MKFVDESNPYAGSSTAEEISLSCRVRIKKLKTAENSLASEQAVEPVTELTTPEMVGRSSGGRSGF